MSQRHPYQAGESLEGFCRACKTDRLHTVIVVDTEGKPIRVSCDYCGSQHNFRGGARLDPPRPPAVEPVAARPAPAAARPASPAARPVPAARESFPIVSER